VAGGECAQDQFSCECFDGYSGEACQFEDVKNNTNPNGQCDGSVCICNEGYIGEQCEIPVCFGTPANNSNSCLDHGYCADKNKCVCDDEEWSGEQCDVPVCDNVPASDDTTCGGQGTCIAPNNCDCHNTTFWIGEYCSDPVCFGKVGDDACSGNGICGNPDNCHCLDGYYGEECEITSCFDERADSADVCSKHGECGEKNECSCKTNYFGNKCQYTYCFGVKSNREEVCNNGLCTDYNTCECIGDFSGPACNVSSCFGVESTSNGVCSGHGKCISKDSCSCNSGYTGSTCDTPTCNSLKPTDNGVCSGHGTCTGPETCSCTTGYTGKYCQYKTCNGKSEIHPQVCGGNGQCTGVDVCSCAAGYSGDQCENIVSIACYGKSSEDPKVCGGKGSCNPQSTCGCITGYSGTQCQYPQCSGISSNDATVCSGKGQCVDTNKCQCRTGYSGANCDTYSCYGKTHTDATVCGGGNNKCIGPDTCQCNDKPGFVQDCSVTICNSVLSTNPAVCNGRGSCGQPNKCQCSANVRGLFCETPICFGKIDTDSRVCSGHGKCNGPDTCSCNEGYTGNQCQTPVCFGLSDPSLVCNSGKGSCVSTDKCSCVANDDVGHWDGAKCSNCQPNYRGNQCKENYCSDVQTCNSNGVCNSEFTCNCKNSTIDGFFAGPFCRQCQGDYYGVNCKLFCRASITCHGHGDCASDGSCKCYDDATHGFFSGSSCATCATDIYGPQCKTKRPLEFRASSTKISTIISEWVSIIPQGIITCSKVVHSQDLPYLGTSPVCGYLTAADKAANRFSIVFGSNPTIDISDDGDSIRMNVGYGGTGQYVAVSVLPPTDPATPKAVLVVPDQISSCDGARLDGSKSIAVDGKVTFKWSAVDGPDATALNTFLSQAKTPNVDIPSHLLSSGSTNKVQLIVESVYGKYSDPVQANLVKSTMALAQAKFRGAEVQDTQRSKFFRLDGYSVIGECFYQNKEVMYTLTQTKGIPVSPKVADGSLLFVPRTFGAFATSYGWKLTVQPVANLLAQSTATVTVNVLLKDLVAKIRFGDLKETNIESFKLDASVSSDPEQSAETESFEWDCRDVQYNSLCPDDILDAVTSATTSQLTVPQGATPGKYLFSIAYSKGSRISTASATIEIVSQPVARITLTNPNINLIPEKGSYSYQGLFTSLGAAKAELRLNDNLVWSQDFTAAMTEKKFKTIIAESNFNTGSNILRAVLIDSLTNEELAYNQVLVQYGQMPPIPGEIVLPDDIVMFQPVTLLTSGWSAYSEQDNPLLYEWAIYVGGVEKHRTQIVQYNSLDLSGLPPGDITIQVTTYTNSRFAWASISKEFVIPLSDCDSSLDAATAQLSDLPSGYAQSAQTNFFTSIIALGIEACSASSRSLRNERDVSTIVTLFNNVEKQFSATDPLTPFDNPMYAEYGYTLSNLANGPTDSVTDAKMLSFINVIVGTFNKEANTELIEYGTAALFVRAVATLTSKSPSLSQQAFGIIDKVHIYGLSVNALTAVTATHMTVVSGTIDTDDIVQNLIVPSVDSSEYVGEVTIELSSGVQGILTDSSVSTVHLKIGIFDRSINPETYIENETETTKGTLVASNVVSVDLYNADTEQLVPVNNLSEEDRIIIYIPASFDLEKARNISDETSEGYYPSCRYFQELTNQWVTDETVTVVEFNETSIVCSTSHLSIFMATYDYYAIPEGPDTNPVTKKTNKGIKIGLGVGLGVGFTLLLLLLVVLVLAFRFSSWFVEKKVDEKKEEKIEQTEVVNVESTEVAVELTSEETVAADDNRPSVASIDTSEVVIQISNVVIEQTPTTTTIDIPVQEKVEVKPVEQIQEEIKEQPQQEEVSPKALVIDQLTKEPEEPKQQHTSTPTDVATPESETPSNQV
jgi:Na+-transporting methylmalonyl-CoA/oxaloacetate decarboxylase gamma subunit